jgi:hypothetical protein
MSSPSFLTRSLRTGSLLALVGALALGNACSSSSSSPADDDAGRSAGSSSSGGKSSTSGAGSGSSGACVDLTVLNYLAWCSVSIAGDKASAAKSQTVCVAEGTVDLVATPASAQFEIGPAPWHDTAGDTGSGDPGTMSGSGTSETDKTTVDVTGSSKCVWVCCPFTNGTGCPTTDQCAGS